MQKLPPIEKIYEAISAVADGRITIEDGEAKVKSSDYRKEYTVKWDGNVYSANDNASYWGGYAGYPIIALLMLQGKLPMPDKSIVGLLQGISWKELNTKHKNKYDKAVAEILAQLDENDAARIKTAVDDIYKHLESLPITTKRSSLRPPK